MLRIYKASAGSGKTYRLTERYITLLLTDRDQSGRHRLVPSGTRGRHRHILAITFTNKATEEMKRRIVHELGVLAGMERGWTRPSPFMPGLRELTGASEEDIADRARTALRDLLHDFGYFSVSTIDSFFQTVLRTFAREAELPGNYEVDLDQDRPVMLGIHEMLQSINRTEGADETERAEALRLEHWLSELMTDLMRRGKGFNIFNRNTDVHKTIVNFMKRVSDETYAKHSQEIDRYLADPSRLVKLTAAVRKRIEQLSEQCRRACEAAADLPGLTKFAGENFARHAREGYVKPKAGGIPKTLSAIAENPAKAFLAKAMPDDVALALAQSAANSIIASRQIGLLTETIHQLYVLGLMNRINRYIAEFRSSTSTLLLSDTNSILHRIIGNDPTPFVYERTGQWIHHFLIDEFQDTSELQWLNLKSLIEESLANGRENLVIGDEKQCIYRFRNSDPTLLAGLHEQFGADATIEGDNLQGNTNWRSAAEVVKFNNTFFKAMADLHGADSGVGRIYSNVTQKVSDSKRNLPGYVLFEPYNTEGSDDARQTAFSHTIEQIRRQIESGYTPADIAVLFRKGRDGAMFIEQLLARVEADPDYPQVKVMSDESLYVSRSRAVRLVISVLRILASKETGGDSRTLSERRSAELLSRYEQGLSSGREATDALADAVSATLEERPVEIAAEVTDVECSTLVSVISRVINSYVSPEQRQAENVYLTALTDLALDMSSRGIADLRSFLQWWDEKGRLSAVPAADDVMAIRVMTIHKSKGLEFACVHIPYCDSPNPPEGIKWFEPADLDFADPELVPALIPLHPGALMAESGYAEPYAQLQEESAIDEANVVYVAFTRAMRELIVGYHTEGGARRPLSDMICNVADHASSPGFLERVSAEFPAEGGEAYTRISVAPDGRIEVGEPTEPVSESKHRTLLDPEETVAVPASQLNFSTELWESVRLDDDCDPMLPSSGGIEVQRKVMNMAMREIRGPKDISRCVNRLAAQGRIAADMRRDFEELLRQRVSGPATAQWFEGYRRVVMNRTVSAGNGGAATADRLVWHRDGTLDVIQYLGDDSEAAERNAGFLVRALSRAGQGKVRGFVWDPVTGRVTAVER